MITMLSNCFQLHTWQATLLAPRHPLPRPAPVIALSSKAQLPALRRAVRRPCRSFLALPLSTALELHQLLPCPLHQAHPFACSPASIPICPRQSVRCMLCVTVRHYGVRVVKFCPVAAGWLRSASCTPSGEYGRPGKWGSGGGLLGKRRLAQGVFDWVLRPRLLC